MKPKISLLLVLLLISFSPSPPWLATALSSRIHHPPFPSRRIRLFCPLLFCILSTSTPAPSWWTSIRSLLAAATALVHLRETEPPLILPLQAPRVVAALNLPRHEAKLAVGLNAGTKGALLAAELSEAVMGRCFTMSGRQIQHSSGPSRRAESTSLSRWSRVSTMAMFSLLSGGWMWLLVFSTLSPTTRPTFQLRLKVALLVECGLHLAPPALHHYQHVPEQAMAPASRAPEGHDIPRVELQGLKWEPSQF